MQTKAKMTNLEKIREAWRIGWAAVVKLDYIELIVVYVGPSCVLARLDTAVPNIYDALLTKDFKIIGYKYAGELAGNEEPREGQKFTIRGGNEIVEFERLHHAKRTNNGFIIKDFGFFEKIQLEPYFE